MYQCISRTAANLQWLRKQVEISIEELALLLKKDIHILEEWESGEREPCREGYQQLSNFFGLDKSAILLLDLSEMDLFTSRKQRAVKKKRAACKRLVIEGKIEG